MTVVAARRRRRRDGIDFLKEKKHFNPFDPIASKKGRKNLAKMTKTPLVKNIRNTCVKKMGCYSNLAFFLYTR